MLCFQFRGTSGGDVQPKGTPAAQHLHPAIAGSDLGGRSVTGTNSEHMDWPLITGFPGIEVGTCTELPGL